MDLRDLANEEGVATVTSSRTASPRKEPERPLKTLGSAGPPGVRWLVLDAPQLDDQSFLLVFEKTDLREARNAHPGKVIYFPAEIEELRRVKDAPDYLKALEIIHLAKKRFGGWIIPSDSIDRHVSPKKRPGGLYSPKRIHPVNRR